MNVHTPTDPPIEFNCAGTKILVEGQQFKGLFHPIPIPLWDAIIGFHRQISINIQAESVSYHRWHAASGQYHSLIPWQNTSVRGLSVSVGETPTSGGWQDPKNAKLLDDYKERWGEEFFPACTIHTHVDAQAFESGTDAADEKDNPGWHITLGKLLRNNSYHFDFRVRVPKIRRLREIIDVERPYKLDWRHLFIPNHGIEKYIHTTPGTTDWHAFIERVKAR